MCYNRYFSNHCERMGFRSLRVTRPAERGRVEVVRLSHQWVTGEDHAVTVAVGDLRTGPYVAVGGSRSLASDGEAVGSPGDAPLRSIAVVDILPALKHGSFSSILRNERGPTPRRLWPTPAPVCRRRGR
ncbi:hypothetical protein GCM10008995_06460 [Halobellus salinus]|uniref:Uncharacterized protein n=1 Tax=Halobellus salinus TaxID=931585 RepID=A0A830E832_9EURY|nr:hypothetical protein GCM10008995_06460 [Halobellus salinus]